MPRVSQKSPIPEVAGCEPASTLQDVTIKLARGDTPGIKKAILN
jgi:hypothetical protein